MRQDVLLKLLAEIIQRHREVVRSVAAKKPSIDEHFPLWHSKNIARDLAGKLPNGDAFLKDCGLEPEEDKRKDKVWDALMRPRS